MATALEAQTTAIAMDSMSCKAANVDDDDVNDQGNDNDDENDDENDTDNDDDDGDGDGDGDDNDNDNDNDDADDDIAVAVAASEAEESSNAALEASKKRKRPTASLLKHAMEELDRIWVSDNNLNNDSNNNNLNNDNNNDNDNHDSGDSEHQDGTNPKQNHLFPSEMDRERIHQTTSLLVKVFTEDIHEPAIRALVANEELKDTQMRLKNELETNQREVERLRRSEQRSKEAIKNLLKAVGESAEASKDQSQSKLVEAKMRADLLHARSERDESHKDSLVAQRSLELLSQDVTNLKTEKTKLQHDKLRLEREVRSARALADGLSSSLLGSHNDHHREDLDYYKTKAKELEVHLQGMTARLAEKNKEIQEFRRCRNRNLSQQRLEALRANEEPADSDPNSKDHSKRSRFSY